MQIYDNREVESCAFRALDPGDAFQHDEEVMMKLDIPDNGIDAVDNAVSLRSGKTRYFDKYQAVQPINAYIQIEDD